MLNDCCDNLSLLRVDFTLDDENGNACLRILHESEVRTTEVLCLDCFRQIDDDKVNMHVSYRINSLKQKNLLVQSRMRELNEILRGANPNLFEQIQRSVSGRTNTEEGAYRGINITQN